MNEPRGASRPCPRPRLEGPPDEERVDGLPAGSDQGPGDDPPNTIRLSGEPQRLSTHGEIRAADLLIEHLRHTYLAPAVGAALDKKEDL